MVALVAFLGLLAPPTADAGTLGGLPRLSGWRAATNRLAPDIDLVRYRKLGQEIVVTRIGPDASVDLRQVLSRDRVAGDGRRTERTSWMCRRTGCIVGINGTFFDRRRGVPVGAVVADGEIVRSTRTLRDHIGIEGMAIAPFVPPSLRLVFRAPAAPPPKGDLITPVPEEQVRRIDGLNLPRSKNGIVAYTRKMADSTPGLGGVELVLRGGSGTAMRGQRSPYEATEIRAGGGPIPADGVVLSALGQGAEQLREWWTQIQDGRLSEQVDLEADPSPAILLASKPGVLLNGEDVSGSSFLARSRHPRTIIGSTGDGSTVLVTIDGRQRSRRGMTLPEAARFLRRLGVVDAYNLDGGGSSTMTVRGRVVNNPPGAERRVATALVVVPASP